MVIKTIISGRRDSYHDFIISRYSLRATNTGFTNTTATEQLTYGFFVSVRASKRGQLDSLRRLQHTVERSGGRLATHR